MMLQFFGIHKGKYKKIAHGVGRMRFNMQAETFSRDNM